MAREFYNWDQVVSYSVIAIHNLKQKNIEVNEEKQMYINHLYIHLLFYE